MIARTRKTIASRSGTTQKEDENAVCKRAYERPKGQKQKRRVGRYKGGEQPARTSTVPVLVLSGGKSKKSPKPGGEEVGQRLDGKGEHRILPVPVL